MEEHPLKPPNERATATEAPAISPISVVDEPSGWDLFRDPILGQRFPD